MTSAHASREVTLIETLSRGLSGDRLVIDPDVLGAISHDEAEWAPAGDSVAAVRARSTEDVGRIVAACAERNMPVVARGAGTGLSGGATPMA